MNTYIIRKAEQRDVAGIMRLLAQVAEVHHIARPDLFKGGATKYNEEELKVLITDLLTPVFVFDEGGEILGHAFCQIKEVKDAGVLCDVKTLYIDDICVDETARKKGVGRALYEYCLGFAKSIGCYNLTLNVWKGNDGAEAFYRKMGMKEQKITMETIL